MYDLFCFFFFLYLYIVFPQSPVQKAKLCFISRSQPNLSDANKLLNRKDEMGVTPSKPTTETIASFTNEKFYNEIAPQNGSKDQPQIVSYNAISSITRTTQFHNSISPCYNSKK